MIVAGAEYNRPLLKKKCEMAKRDLLKLPDDFEGNMRGAPRNTARAARNGRESQGDPEGSAEAASEAQAEAAEESGHLRVRIGACHHAEAEAQAVTKGEVGVALAGVIILAGAAMSGAPELLAVVAIGAAIVLARWGYSKSKK